MRLKYVPFLISFLFAFSLACTEAFAFFNMGHIKKSGSAPSQVGYFVWHSVALQKGNLGGIAGADATCLSDLIANDWLGKASAGTLTAARVKAWLCDSTSCNNLVASTTYYFAISNSPTSGGASFTTNGSGQGPGDSANWDQPAYFGDHPWTGNYWTGRAAGSNTLWSNSPSGNHCVDWSNATGGQNGEIGHENNTDSKRWLTTTSPTSCNTSVSLICFVNPE